MYILFIKIFLDVYTKRTANAPKGNVKYKSYTTAFKDNEKPSTSNNNSKKLVSNVVKPQTSINRYSRLDRRNNRYAIARKNDSLKEQESIKHDVTTNQVEGTTNNPTEKSCLIKPDLETDSKITDTTNQDVRKTQNASQNKEKISQKQRTGSKQFALKRESKEQEFKRSTSTLNHTADKTKISEKTDKVTQVSKTSDTLSNESSVMASDEKKNEQVIFEKNVQSDQKVNNGINLRRSSTFSAQYKNSFSKCVQPKNTSENTKYSPNYRRSSSYIRHNATSDRERAANVECKDTSNIMREYTSTDTFTKSDVKTEEVTTDVEKPIKKQNKMNYARSRNVKSINKHETDALAVTNQDIIDPIKAVPYLTGNEEFTSSSADYLAQEPIISKQCEDSIAIADVNEQSAEVNDQTNDEEMNLSKHSPNLYSNNFTVRPQTNSIDQRLLKADNIQRVDDVNQLGNDQTVWNNDSSDNATQNIATVVNTQQSTRNMHYQPNITPAGNQIKPALQMELDGSKFYDQQLQLPHIPNTFNALPYEYNIQATSSDSDIAIMPTFETMDSNRETSNALHRYTPHMQQRQQPVTAFPDFHPVSSQTNRWSPSMQNGFHVEQFVNTAQPAAAMHVYNSGAFGSDDYSNLHERNCLPPHQVLYAPCMQTWNTPLQYPLISPIYHNPPCTNYTMFPNAANQSNNYNDLATVDSMCMHDQQHKYIHYVPMSNNYGNTGSMQMHTNSNYVKGTHGCDPTNCTAEARNVIDSDPMKFNRYYKYQDNYRGVYDVPQYATGPHTRSQQSFTSARGAPASQYNTYCPPNYKYNKSNGMQGGINYMQMSKNQKGQKQNFASEDNGLEDIPPIISPKEYVTNNINFSNKPDQFSTRVFKPDFKMRNTGYRQPPLPQRYNGGFRRNVSYQHFPKEHNYQNFPKEHNYHNFPKEHNTSHISVGRGISKKE